MTVVADDEDLVLQPLAMMTSAAAIAGSSHGHQMTSRSEPKRVSQSFTAFCVVS